MKPMKKAPWRDDTLGYLIGEENAKRFFADNVYEYKDLLVEHNDPTRFTSLLSIERIDELISGNELREGMLDMANAARPITRDTYTTSNGLIDRGVVARQFQTGATIVFQQLQEIEPTLADFCRALEYMFSCHVQTNIYVTPPGEQGFKTHYDNHDVFVLQISGKKRWRFYGTPVSIPFRGEGFSADLHDPGPVSKEFVLNAGDCVYIPRGLAHDATSEGDEPSLHITTGLIVRTWADLILEAVSEVALKNEALREGLPPGFAHRDFDRTEARAHFRKVAELISSEAQMDRAFDLMVDNFIQGRSSNISGSFVDAARSITDTDKFRARPYTPWRLIEDPDKVVLIAPGGDLNFKTECKLAIERALTGKSFVKADLESDLAEEIMRRLQAFGLVQRL